jgi:hypothetical protein
MRATTIIRMVVIVSSKVYIGELPSCIWVRNNYVNRIGIRFKHKTRRSKGGSYPLPHLYETCGLVRLTRLGRDVPWAKAN